MDVAADMVTVRHAPTPPCLSWTASGFNKCGAVLHYLFLSYFLIKYPVDLFAVGGSSRDLELDRGSSVCACEHWI